MVLFYMVLLCLSAFLAAWAALRLLRRMAPLANLSPRAGWCVALPTLGFLTVVGAPPPMLVASLLVGGLVWMMPNRMAGMLPQTILIIAGVLLALTGLPAPKASYLTELPIAAAYAAASIAWLASIAAAGLYSDRARGFSLGGLLMLAAVAAAPALAPNTESIAFDATIIASALVGVLLAGGASLPMGQGPRLALGIMMGFLPISAAWHGAWIAAAASLAIWLGAAAWAWASHPAELHHA